MSYKLQISVDGESDHVSKHGASHRGVTLNFRILYWWSLSQKIKRTPPLCPCLKGKYSMFTGSDNPPDPLRGLVVRRSPLEINSTARLSIQNHTAKCEFRRVCTRSVRWNTACLAQNVWNSAEFLTWKTITQERVCNKIRRSCKVSTASSFTEETRNSSS